MNRTLKRLRAADPNAMVIMEGSQESGSDPDDKKKDWALEKAEAAKKAKARASEKDDGKKEGSEEQDQYEDKKEAKVDDK